MRILRELQADGSLLNVELARRANLSPSPCPNRVKLLKASGLIRQFVALLAPNQLGLQLNVFIQPETANKQRTAGL